MAEWCRVCDREMTSEDSNEYDVHTVCMPTMRAQFYAELYRYRDRHPHERME